MTPLGHDPQARSALIRRTERACDDVCALVGERDADTVAAVRRALAEPLRVAVVGRVKAGKSTLVNALVGRRIAPTAAGECTRVVTWYRYGAPDRAELVLTDGRRRTLRIDGGLPEDLGVPAEDVDHLEVHLQAGALREMTVIDTPGLATATTENETATRRAIVGADALTANSRSAATQADAVLFLVRDAERADEVAFLRDFLAASGELGASAVNAVGVLSHADVFGSGPWDGADPVDLAADRARRLAVDRAAEVSDVRPVAALLAETARTGRLREADARTLAGLAGVEAARLRLWEQLGPPDGVPPATMTRLFELLGPYGMATGRSVGGGAEPLLRWLEDRSGLAELEALIRRRFLLRADVLKADHALEVLDRLAAGLPVPQDAAVRAAVEEARLAPELHPLREVRALSLLTRTAPDSPLVATLTALTEGTDDAARLGPHPGGDPAAYARRLAAQAQARITAAGGPAEAEAARTAARSYLLLARRLAS
ncbi:dynamin family protein [Jidongwangia harbinensis]|uniref:dynamin family protein n=1 Tax=Jidongwangia harbinensis TaxID=2878561 RepID=UPI001CD96694|nr:dynamin family protein [Jidongwangia harbinensis]MCA2216645.1 dynamin family protein [Jidongwangia harbinensis]